MISRCQLTTPFTCRLRPILPIVFLTIGISWLSGCGSENNPTSSTPPTPQEPDPPPVTTPVSPFADIELGILAGINIYRSQGGTCGEESYEPSSPILWNDDLAEAARVHMEDHLANDLTSTPHTGSDGSSVADRVRRASQQTAWFIVSENVAWSQGIQRNQVKDTWLVAWHESPVHCRNQLNSVFNRAGVSVGVKAGRYVAVVVFGQNAGA